MNTLTEAFEAILGHEYGCRYLNSSKNLACDCWRGMAIEKLIQVVKEYNEKVIPTLSHNYLCKKDGGQFKECGACLVERIAKNQEKYL